jgi:hydroxymethylbilane synthase
VMPAVSQGIIGIECRMNDDAVLEVLHKINHTPTFLQARAERAFLHAMHGGCQLPLGCASVIDGEIMHIAGFVARVDGTNAIHVNAQGSINEPEHIGIKLAEMCYAAGAGDILQSIRHE